MERDHAHAMLRMLAVRLYVKHRLADLDMQCILKMVGWERKLQGKRFGSDP